MEYFKWLPSIEYSNNTAINILARAKIRDYLKKNTYIYQPYIVKDYDRPDTLANKYYGSFKYAWLIFYANNIYDPIREWVMDNHNFYKYLEHKYQETKYLPGTEYAVGDKVQFNSTLYNCTTTHLSEDIVAGVKISDNQFKRLKNHWNFSNTGQFGYFFSSYFTDQAQYLQITSATGTELTVSGTLPLACDSVIVMNLLDWALYNSGELRPGYAVAAQTIKEYRDGNNLVIDYSTWLNLNDLNKRAVSYFDYEDALNESRRNINLIDSRYASQILQEFKKLFS